MHGLLTKIKSICDKKGISLAELERKAGLGNGTVGRWDESVPNLASLDAVAKVLGTTSAELIK